MAVQRKGNATPPYQEAFHAAILDQLTNYYFTRSLPARWWHVEQRAEQTISFVVWTSRKEQRIRRPISTAPTGAMTELKRPQTIDRDRLPGRRVKQTNSREL